MKTKIRLNKMLSVLLAAAMLLTLLPVTAFAGAGTVGWNYRSPLPAAGVLNTIIVANGNYMAVGYDGTLITSANGENWTTVDVGPDTERFNGIAYGGGKTVIVGNCSDYMARIFTSGDGTSWTETAAIPRHQLNDVVYGGGTFVAVGAAGKVLTSTDGLNWSAAAIDATFSLTSVTYDTAHSRFAAVGFGSDTGKPSGGIMTSSDGVSWTKVYDTGSTNGPAIWDVTCKSGTLVAVGGTNNYGGYIYTSTDGTAWSPTSLSGRLYSVTYDGTGFMAVGQTSSNTAVVATSTDGTTWDQKSYETPPSSFSAVAVSGTRYVAVGGVGNIYTSDDNGNSWTRRTLGATATLYDAAWNGTNLYVAVGSGGTIQTSPDGVNWTLQSSGTTQLLNKVEYLNDRFIAVGVSGTILTSPDGVSWTLQPSGTTLNLRGIAYGAGKYLVTGGSGYNSVVLSSADGGTWSTVTGSGLYGVAYPAVAFGNGVFLALTEYGGAVKSDDGTTWVQVTRLPGTSYPTDMIYADGKFAAVGGYGEVYLSSDSGASWTVVQTDSDTDSRDSYLDSYSWSIAYGGGNFVAVGNNGKIIASADGGTTWFLQPSDIPVNHYFDTDNTRDPIGGATISWASSKLQYIAADGKVTCPAFGTGDQAVYLTATITKGTATDTRTFITYVKENQNSDIQAVTDDYTALTFDTIKGSNTAADNITSNLTLPGTGANGSTITWASNNTTYIANDGTVTRPAAGAADVLVTLTATIAKGAASDTKTFHLTVKAIPAQPSGGGGGSSGTTYQADVKAGNGIRTTLPVTVNNGIGTVNLGAQGLAQSGTMITTPAIPGINTYTVGIPVPDLSTPVEQGSLTLDTRQGSITVPSDMLTGIAGITGSKAIISIGAGGKADLPEDVKAAIGDRPLLQLTLAIDGRQTDWSNPAAPVTVRIPYQPTAEELANPESIVIWYIDGSGKLNCVPRGHYDPGAGSVSFITTHFSGYAVGYHKVSFGDVAAGAWYYDAVSFIGARGITSGTGNSNYSPDAKLTRGEFLVLMMNAYGIAPDEAPTDNFADAGNTYYTGYLAAAKRLGISAGIGDHKYAPAAQISRQEMFTLLHNALQVIGQLPAGNSGKTLASFTDSTQISPWATEAMALLIETGTVGGSDGKLNPTGTTTRAEMAQVLYHLLGK